MNTITWSTCPEEGFHTSVNAKDKHEYSLWLRGVKLDMIAEFYKWFVQQPLPQYEDNRENWGLRPDGTYGWRDFTVTKHIVEKSIGYTPSISIRLNFQYWMKQEDKDETMEAVLQRIRRYFGCDFKATIEPNKIEFFTVHQLAEDGDHEHGISICVYAYDNMGCEVETVEYEEEVSASEMEAEGLKLKDKKVMKEVSVGEFTRRGNKVFRKKTKLVSKCSDPNE